MRLAILSCIAILASASGGHAQPAPGAGQPASQPGLQSRNPAYNISSFRDLVQLCSSDRNDPNYPGRIGLCAGYLSGILDYHLADTAWTGGRRYRRVCLSGATPTRMEVAQSLVNWDQTNHQADDAPAVEGVMRFFMASYPCQPPRSAGRPTRPPG